MNWLDPDGDVERIRAELLMPSGEKLVKELLAVRAGFTNAAGTNVIRPFLLNYLNDPGAYVAEFQLIDRSGRTSEVRSAQIELDYSAPAPPEITGFSPGTGAPGSVVNLFINNLGSLGTNYQITLAGIPCTIVTNEFSFGVQIPTGAVTAPFKLVSGAQVISSYEDFVVPPFISLESDRAEASPGEPVQFSTFIRSATNRMVTFFVNGVAGGNAIVGLISGNGLYRLPLLPPTNIITVVAALTTQPGISATGLVQVLPPTSINGIGWVSATNGGSVSTTEGDASLDVPPGALTTNAYLSIARLRGTNLPPATPGRRLLGLVRLGPDGIVFNQPVTVTVPLAETRPPGTVLALKYFNRATGAFVDEGLTAIVSANGREATGPVTHFSEIGVDEVENVAPTGPPLITSLRAQTTFHEGLAVPILITGQNLVPGLRVEVLLAGQPTGDVVPSNAIFETNRLGLLLTIATLTNLNFGAQREYQLRLVNGSNQSASTNLQVLGLDELRVPPGVQTNLFSLHLFSEIEIGAGAVVNTSGGLTLLAHGPVHIAGRINARGGNGAPSVDEAPGTNRFFSDFTIRGGDGGRPDEYGHNSFLQLSSRGDFTYGHGGAPGEDSSFIVEFINAILDLASCVGGNLISCGQFVGDIIEIVGEIGDMQAGTSVGRPGLPGARASSLLGDHGHGGGGGGGGGDLNLFDAGEGGGAGGHGGNGVVVITRGDLVVDGRVDTRGGDGGDGGENTVTTYHSGGDNRAILLEDTPSSNRGGGGGGGSGGNIALLARGGFRLGSEGSTDARGGNPGNSLFRFRDIDVSSGAETSRRVRLVDAGYPITPSGRIQTQGALVPARALPDFVTDRGLLQLQLPPAASSFSPPVTVTIRGESTNQVRQITFTTSDTGFRRANLLFFPGFNSVAVLEGGRVPDNSMLHRLVLYLDGPDSDGDGLSDADEAALGSNPLVADTDGDGLSDFDEVLMGLSPITSDTDGDLLSDADELNGGTDPRKRDTDGDGFWDGWEIKAGTSPLVAQSSIPLFPPGTLFAEAISSIHGRVLAVVNPVNGQNGGAGSREWRPRFWDRFR